MRASKKWCTSLCFCDVAINCSGRVETAIYVNMSARVRARIFRAGKNIIKHGKRSIHREKLSGWRNGPGLTRVQTGAMVGRRRRNFSHFLRDSSRERIFRGETDHRGAIRVSRSHVISYFQYISARERRESLWELNPRISFERTL